MKDDEVARIRLEEKENFRRELDKARKDVSFILLKIMSYLKYFGKK